LKEKRVFGRFCPLASLVSNYYYSIFIVFTPNAKQEFLEKRKENEERRRFREVEIGGAGPLERRLSKKVPLYLL
tara:strand:- start:220 stop:441 length:222 start_codon:yes stop_codon:yes gene_type:complete